MDQNIAQAIVKEIYYSINVITGPNFHPETHLNANRRLNEIIKTDIYTNCDLYLNIAMVLINKMESFSQEISNDSSSELIVYYAFNILENLVKYQWPKLNADWKMKLKTFSIHCCNSRLFDLFLNSLNPNKLSTSTLILNTCSRLITEIFIQEWPNNWLDFLSNITQNCSLVTLYTLMNISDYLTKLFLPDNSKRRKEITKILLYENEKLLNYFSKCLLVLESNEQMISLEYKKLIVIKSLEALESLLEWYHLNEKIIMQIISIATPHLDVFDDVFLYRSKILSFRCIEIIIKRQVKRDDSILITNIFFDLNEKKFSYYLVTQSLNFYLNLIRQIELNNELFELFILILDIAVEIVCRVINLFNQEFTHKSIIESCIDNQLFWSTFIVFCFDCLQYNNVNFDEILFRFIILYSRSHQVNAYSFKSINSLDNTESSKSNKILFPITGDLFHSIPLKLMDLIGNFKIEPKPESCTSKMLNFIDSYESYLRLFKDNKSKFINVILNNFIQNHPQCCRIFSYSLLRNLLGPLPEEVFDPDFHLNTNIKSWNVAATMCSTLIPKLQLSPQYIKMLEIYFSRLLDIIKDFNLNDAQNLNGILSCISSMSPFYNSFSSELIKKLIDEIFVMTVKVNGYPRNDQNITNLQNHLNSLFIKLAKNCVTLFLPYFQIMLSSIENFRENDKIGLISSYFLYEGLFILSNHLNLEEQRNFLINHFQPQIIWIINYDFGEDGVNFFNDIGLSKEPLFNINHLPTHYYTTFIKISSGINLLIRLFKRIDSNRCLEILWPIMLNYMTSFCKIVAFIHQLWFYYEQKNPILSKLIHPFYHKYLFEEIPFYYLGVICNDQTHIFPVDKYKLLMKKWVRKSPPSPELIGLHMQHRFWVFYSQLINFLNITLSYLLYFYTNHSSLQTTIENYIRTINSLICSNLKFMPFFVYHELIRLYFQCLSNYSPRSERFLINSGCVETLTQFMEFMFCKLNENLNAIQQEKNKSTENSEPNSYCTSFRQIYAASSFNNDNRNCLEICLEAIVNNICSDYVLFLNSIFSPSKNIGNIINKYESISQIDNELDEEMDDDIVQDNELVITENNMGESVLGDIIQYNEEGLLSKFIMTHNPKPLVFVVISCLPWPISNLRSQICDVNHKLICSLISRNMINNINAFFDLADRILEAISHTKRSDPDTLNRLVNLLLLIYEKFVVKNNLTNIVNIKLSQICGSDLNQWNMFGECFRHGISNSKNTQKKIQKLLRSLVEDIAFKELSLMHAMDKPKVLSLGTLDNNKKQNIDDDLDTEFLSWLLEK